MLNLFINSIAGSEIVIILLFVLIFFGAKSIPGMSRSLGRGLRQIRDASQEVQDEIRRTTGDMKKEMNLKRTLDQAAEDVQKPFKEVVREVKESTSSVQESVHIQDRKPKNFQVENDDATDTK